MRALPAAAAVALMLATGPTALAGAARPAPVSPDDAQSCQVGFARLIAGGPRADLPTGCWRIGPLTLGMTDAELMQAMPAPVQTSTVTGDAGSAYVARVFAYPADWRSRLAAGAAPRLRFVETLSAAGQVVRIGTTPAVRITTDPCLASAAWPTVAVGGEPAGFRPFERFAGVPVGTPVSNLAGRFGRRPAGNASRDWWSYFPAPITFDADPRNGRILGFAIAASEGAATREATVAIRVRRDPDRCRIVGLRFGDVRP